MEILGERPDGFRAVLETDEDPAMPDGDYFGAVYLMPWTGNRPAELLAGCHAGHGAGLGDVIADAWRTFTRGRGDRAVLLARYLRAWHGAVFTGSTFASCDGSFVNVITAECLRECWGFTGPAQFAAANPGRDVSADILTEWRAWADGDVYAYAIESASYYVNRDDARDVIIRWEPVWTVGGFYGYPDGYAAARDTALGELAAYGPGGMSAGGAA